VLFAEDGAVYRADGVDGSASVGVRAERRSESQRDRVVGAAAARELEPAAGSRERSSSTPERKRSAGGPEVQDGRRLLARRQSESDRAPGEVPREEADTVQRWRGVDAGMQRRRVRESRLEVLMR
jgi:hypothetical protein